MVEFSQLFKDYAGVGLNIILGISGWAAIIFLLVCVGAGVVQVVKFYIKNKKRTDLDDYIDVVDRVNLLNNDFKERI